MSMNNLTTTGIPIWNSFVFSQNLTSIIVERRRTLGNGTTTTDKATQLPDSYISKTDTNSLTSGDWTLTTGTSPCFYFNNSNKDYKFIPEIVGQLIIVVLVDGNQSKAENGLLFGVFDDIRPRNVVEPFNAGIPSVNTYTFTLTERKDQNNKEYLYFTVNTQNYHPMTFANGSIAARFLYSPDTYLSIKYVEKPRYTIYDIIAASGGNLTYAIALWIILFDENSLDGRLNELTDKEITKKINKIVDEKLWFLEQTISRHYLSGFRLRRYNSDLKKLKHKNGHYDEYNVNYDEIQPSPRRYSSSSHNSYPVVQLKQVDLGRKRKQRKQSESNPKIKRLFQIQL
ncbi:2958_t:CDS:2 [Diversispora eburnea]|uniref:2958_t:CDS:1 n=1 Tax=Diversispora eburnea TaxID=1213867 RepID=A0A9N9AE15_9GLOM|nr:2958_t:CDS:2 [Diversispora eburnea]